MVKTYKFGEPSKVKTFRVPESHSNQYQEDIQAFIDQYFNFNKNPIKVLEQILKKFIPALQKHHPDIDFEEQEFKILKKLQEEL